MPVVPVVVVVVPVAGDGMGFVPEAPVPAAAIATKATTNNSTPSPSAMTLPSRRDAPVICVNNGKWSSGMTSTSGRSLFYGVNRSGKALQRPTAADFAGKRPGHALKFRPTELSGVRMKHGRHDPAAAAEYVAGWPS